MVVEKHEEPLMQLMVLYKLGPSAPEVHLAPPIVVHFHFIGSSSPRLFAEDCFTKLTPIHELGEFQRNTLYLSALSADDAEEGIDLGRRRRSIAWSSARTWSSSRYLGFVFTPHRAARVPLHRCGR
jgi:predicted component of type VI protein secretion system